MAAVAVMDAQDRVQSSVQRPMPTLPGAFSVPTL